MFGNILQVIPLVHIIEHDLEKPAPPGSGLQSLKNDLLASMKIRFSKLENDQILASATLLDPRFKTSPFQDPQKAENAKARLLIEAEQLLKDDVRTLI